MCEYSEFTCDDIVKVEVGLLHTRVEGIKVAGIRFCIFDMETK